MGGAMALNLVRAGWTVRVFDIDAGKIGALADAGAQVATSAAEAASGAPIVLASLPHSEVSVRVMETELLPVAHEGQVFVELGTVVPAEQRRLAAAFAGRGAALLDVPVSGGPGGAESAQLLMFAGGDRETFDNVLPVLESLGSRITYCGPRGHGQIVKCVNQLGMGLANAAAVESLAFGVRAGVDAEVLAQAVGAESGWRKLLASLAERIAAGDGETISVKAGQFEYFLDEARRKGFTMPITEALDAFLEGAEPVTREANRMAASFWRELNRPADG